MHREKPARLIAALLVFSAMLLASGMPGAAVQAAPQAPRSGSLSFVATYHAGETWSDNYSTDQKVADSYANHSTSSYHITGRGRATFHITRVSPTGTATGMLDERGTEQEFIAVQAAPSSTVPIRRSRLSPCRSIRWLRVLPSR